MNEKAPPKPPLQVVHPRLPDEIIVRIDPKETDASWRDELVLSKGGNPLPNTSNITLIMQQEDGWRGCFGFNEFTGRKTLLKPIPGSRTPRSTFEPRPVQDDDEIDAQCWFQRNGMPMVSLKPVCDAIGKACNANVYNSLQDHIIGLPEHDGKPRLDTWLGDYLGADNSSPDVCRVNAEIGAKWLIAAIARAMEPGCASDHVLILEGEQGIGKSSAFRIIASKQFFGDALPPIHSKDAAAYLRGIWIVELAELSAMRKAEVEEIKAFLSRKDEKFRPAYGRNELSFPRTCIFGGSTNSENYLMDSTGNRRFWPVRLTGRLDLDALRTARDQLLAEALVRYRSGEPWWTAGHVTSLVRDQQASRVEIDPWMDRISAYCDQAGSQGVCIPQIAIDACGLEMSRQNRTSSNRVAACLRALGFTKDKKITTGDFKDRVRFIRQGKSDAE